MLDRLINFSNRLIDFFTVSHLTDKREGIVVRRKNPMMAGGYKSENDFLNRKIETTLAKIKAKQDVRVNFEEMLIAFEYRYIRQYFSEATDPDQKIKEESERMAKFVSELEIFLADDRYPLVMASLRRLML